MDVVKTCVLEVTFLVKLVFHQHSVGKCKAFNVKSEDEFGLTGKSVRISIFVVYTTCYYMYRSSHLQFENLSFPPSKSNPKNQIKNPENNTYSLIIQHLNTRNHSTNGVGSDGINGSKAAFSFRCVVQLSLRHVMAT